MSQKILKCPECGSYTLRNECRLCMKKSEEVKPPKYSPEDKYGEYRRTVKREGLEKKELL